VCKSATDVQQHLQLIPATPCVSFAVVPC
jgi:hypothetical protein